MPVPATPYRREHVALSDGVEVALDWKGDGLPPGAPLVVCAPGQGETRRRGYWWASVVGV